jgi:Arc/MetJ-type ribon-helix-helix transcriptional regulator
MTVHIKPEFEAIIAEDLKNGGYKSAEEYVERAIQLLHEEQLGPIENRDEIASQIESCESTESSTRLRRMLA